MNLAQLRAFVGVVDEGSFTLAAAVLGLTQSGASHAVASLERELGLPLIHRSRTGVVVTAHGERILRHAREALHRVDRIAEDAAAATGRYAGRLRLAGVPSACQLLPPLVAEFGRRYPDVEVVLLEGTDDEVDGWLDDEIADLAVRSRTDFADGTPLAEDRMVAVLDRGHALAGQESITLADLDDDPFVLSDGGCEPLIRELYKAAGLTLRHKLRVRDMATLLALVREQVGITVIPELSFTDRQGLVAIPITPASRRCLTLVTKHAPRIGPARAFLDLADHTWRGQPFHSLA
ncbi:LysR family transcriptional regulator [Kribbella sp. NPDC056345]|uniref:LysR family transcriptional regulator n=1 Tax=Kribbella sp. NPDC056345 TaxID=3345789 RepID=UPI0035D8C91B